MAQSLEKIPRAIMVIAAITLISEYFFINPALKYFATFLSNSVIIIWCFSTLVGLYYGIRYNVYQISKRVRHWQFNVWILVVLVISSAIGLYFSPKSPQYMWLLLNVQWLVFSAIEATLGFVIVEAGYQVMRVKSVESTLLLISAFLVLFRNTAYIRAYLPIVGIIGDWILSIFTGSVMRSIGIGAAIGALSLALRIILGSQRVLGRK